MKTEQNIRAVFDERTIAIYQAYNEEIARSAVDQQTFVSPPYKKDRMTWIKPSFLWMMYRSGWATKKDQEHILSIKIKREGFEWALKNSCLSHFDGTVHSSPEAWKEQMNLAPVRIQWDPEKDILLAPLPYRSIQIGLSGPAVDSYVSDWIVSIDDITEYVHQVHSLVQNKQVDIATSLLPVERGYPYNPQA